LEEPNLTPYRRALTHLVISRLPPLVTNGTHHLIQCQAALLDWQEQGIPREARPTAEYLALHAATGLFQLAREVRRMAFNRGVYREYEEPGTSSSGLPVDVDRHSLVVQRELTALDTLGADHADLKRCNSNIEALLSWVALSSDPSWLVIS
jgi:hypothetical protein